jgi:hypothetical protein
MIDGPAIGYLLELAARLAASSSRAMRRIMAS